MYGGQFITNKPPAVTMSKELVTICVICRCLYFSISIWHALCFYYLHFVYKYSHLLLTDKKHACIKVFERYKFNLKK